MLTSFFMFFFTVEFRLAYVGADPNTVTKPAILLPWDKKRSADLLRGRVYIFIMDL